MKMFVVAAIIFAVLMYIVFAFGFPITDDSADGKLVNLYNTIMVFAIISAILVFCQIMSGARRIEIINAPYGKVLRQQGVIFFGSNVCTSLVFYFLANQSLIFSDHGVLVGTVI